MTLVPLDKNLINKKMLSSKELIWINNYHKKVYNSLKKYMKKLDLKDLKTLLTYLIIYTIHPHI